jgi:hypothetical protein
MKIIRDLWLCSDCMPVAVNGDYSHLDHSYTERGATRLMHEINRGLAKLPGLVPDFGGDPQRERLECDHIGDEICFEFREETDDDREALLCPACGSCDTQPRDDGEMEFSRTDCDVCYSELWGSRFRFAQLIHEDETAHNASP